MIGRRGHYRGWGKYIKSRQRMFKFKLTSLNQAIMTRPLGTEGTELQRSGQKQGNNGEGLGAVYPNGKNIPGGGVLWKCFQLNAKKFLW